MHSWTRKYSLHGTLYHPTRQPSCPFGAQCKAPKELSAKSTTLHTGTSQSQHALLDPLASGDSLPIPNCLFRNGIIETSDFHHFTGWWIPPFRCANLFSTSWNSHCATDSRIWS